ncbi:5-oxoprolinase subunit C family protein [Poritiphilus flavus]|uniref:Allophanate hydrolase subunit 2 family protein n=1 Tax=Poritiphilus flavus TaxID=2697053 RepID=A0A6L9EF11_9FLAO|nr:biotin-dependent carboxyltransferase family protein [Poritiphilus flavus]NAS13088.1 allophanate hydrolase subunit 2 family protein [Poritiphilus flavus]
MIKVLHTGFFSTIQDWGRTGYRNKGVPVSGVMDRYSAAMANALLENEETDALLEITMTGPVLTFDAPTFIAFTGADLPATLNDNPIEAYHVHKVNTGDTLSFGKFRSGFRCYLAIKGGFLSEKVLGSRSFYRPITAENRIKAGMELPFRTYENFTPKITTIKAASLFEETELDVQPGPEYEILSEKQQKELLGSEFTIAKENNRMAYQLTQNLDAHSVNMLTSATLPGTVQLTPSGKIIILMCDGQTTGGYPRILQLSQRAISILSQKKFGDSIAFRLY